MKRYAILTALAVSALLFGSRPAAAIEGFRGQTWGEARQLMPREGDTDLFVQGWVRQGVDWKRWGNLTLNTYATLRYKADTEKFDFNNSIGPGLGVSLEAYCPRGAVAAVGMEYIWDRYFQSDRTNEELVVFLNWYGWWDLKKR